MSNSMFGLSVLAIVLASSWDTGSATDEDLCMAFTQDVSHELAVMKQTPQEVTAAAKPAPGVPRIDPEKLYGLTLAAQSGVTLVANPGRTALVEGSYAGLVKFRVSKAGRYHVSISSSHWIDIIDGTQLLKARAFQGHRRCWRPRKIVQYELPADKELVLQLSGSTESRVIVAITAVAESLTGEPVHE
jgi:hypothetical protein